MFSRKQVARKSAVQLPHDSEGDDESSNSDEEQKRKNKKGRKISTAIRKKQQSTSTSYFDDESSVKIDPKIFDSDEVEDASEIIRRKYYQVNAEYQRNVDKELETDFMQLLENMPKNIRERSNGVPMEGRPRFSIRKFDIYEGCTTTICSFTPEERDQTITFQPIETGEVFPQMIYWVHTEHNVPIADNLKLSHIPYMNEDQDDEQLSQALINLYEEGIHGYQDNWNYLNDWMLHMLILKIFGDYEGDPDVVYYSLNKLFPNKYGFKELPEIFKKLLDKFECEDKDLLEKAKKSALSSDNPKPKPELCLQCKTHDCLLHGLGARIPAIFAGGRWKSKKIPVPPKQIENQCSDECYKEIKREQITEKLELAEEEELNDKIEVWFDKHEVARTIKPILRRFVNGVDIDEFCQFVAERNAKTDHNYSCREAYEEILDWARLPTQMRLYTDREKSKVIATQMHKNFRKNTWSTGIGKLANTFRLVPCKHTGPCGGGNCGCAKSGVCGKYCSCDDSCRMKFPGCRCGPGQCRTKQCQCFYAKWECDPATCKSCGCDFGQNMCKNRSITYGLGKKVRVSKSQIAGYGLFLDEPAEKGDLILEYTGECISSAEAERRGHIYDRFKNSYLFALNDQLCIDAYKMGNLSRFANHSDNHSNCYGKILIVNGEHRIAIFANEELAADTELFFNYSYNKQHKEEFVANDKFVAKPSRKKKETETPCTNDKPSTPEKTNIRKRKKKK